MSEYLQGINIERYSFNELRNKSKELRDKINSIRPYHNKKEFIEDVRKIDNELKRRESEIGTHYSSKRFNNKEICEQHGFDYDKIKIGSTEKNIDMKTIKVIFKIVGIVTLIIIALAILTPFIAGIITGLTQ